MQVLVLAKQPVAGRVKTRLCPPFSPQGAADVAEAALLDTLETVRAVEVARRVLVLDGHYPAAGFDVQPQRGGPMDERLRAAFDDAAAAAPGLAVLLVGMDTPQLRPELLTSAVAALQELPAVLGLSPDGGWWALGLQKPDGALLHGVPTSRADTGARQVARLRAAGLQVHLLPELRDVDTVSDALAVAALTPHSRFAAAVGALTT